MNSQSIGRYDDPTGPGGVGLPAEEVEITRLINDRLRREDCMQEEERETISYRVAEIMVNAKRLYRESLPRLTNVSGESTQTMEEDMEGLRMTFLHMRDLLHDFDSTFFDSMHHDRPAYDFDGEQEEEDPDNENDADGDSEDEWPQLP